MIQNFKFAVASVSVFCLALAWTANGQEQSDQQISKFYDPVVRDIEGWTIKVDPELLTRENEARGQRMIKALANHLQRVEFILSLIHI